MSVSVIIPVLNGAATLPGLLQTVESQTLPPAEVLIVDDGSTDNSVAVAEAWARQSRIHATVLRRGATRGACAVRNIGLMACRGDLIQFADADDLFHPRRLEFMVNALGAAPHAEIGWSTFLPFTGSAPEFWKGGQPCVRRVAGLRVPLEISTFGWTLMFRRSLLERMGGWDERLRIWQDFNLAMRAAAAVQEGVFVNAALNYYRQDGKRRISNSQSEREKLRGRLFSMRMTLRATEGAPRCARRSLRMRVNHECYHLFRSTLGSVPQHLLRPLLGRVLRGPSHVSERIAAGLLVAGSLLAPEQLVRLKLFLQKSA